jgi:hypothetical protein
MNFRKRGAEVRAAVERVIVRERDALKEASARFEREKEKSALQRMRQLEINIERFERILKHTTADESYELTEQDLVDFGL